MIKKRLLFLNLMTSFYVVAMQMSLNTALSFIFNNSIFTYSFFTGLFLFSMSIGVYFSERINNDNPEKMILYNSLFLVNFAAFSILSLIYVNEYHLFFYNKFNMSLNGVIFLIGIITTILLGTSSGLELPLLSSLENSKKFINKVLAFDYIGSFIGIIIFLYLFLIKMGLISTIVYLQLFMNILILIIFNKSIIAFKYTLYLYLLSMSLNILFLYNIDFFKQLLLGVS